MVGLPFPLEEVKNQNDIAPTFCLWNKRSVYCNVVSFGPQFVELHPLNVILCCFVRRNKWIVTNGLIVKKITIGFTLKNNFEKLIYYLLLAVAFLNCLGEQHMHAGATKLVNGIVVLVN